jgi:hypothetical protein
MDLKLNGQQIRIKNSEGTYIDIKEPYGNVHYAHQVDIYPKFHYVVIVQIKDYMGCSVVVFKDKTDFENWLGLMKDKVKIIKNLTN